MVNKVNNGEGDSVIILRSVFGKVGQKYYIQPCVDPKTGRLPECVKRVNSGGDMIMTDAERNSGKYYIPEDKVFIIEDGTTFQLDDPYQKAEWEAIKNCILIAPSRFAKDKNGDNLIDGVMDKYSHRPRYGAAELYIYNPGAETRSRVSRKKLINKACNYILDEDSADNLVKYAKLLGKNMKNMPSADIEDYLLQIAEKNPEKIISLYTGTDTSLRLLFIDAMDRHIIISKNKLFIYADNIVLGATDEAVLTYFKQPKNKKVLDLIRRETYPEYEKNTEDDKDTKSKK